MKNQLLFFLIAIFSFNCYSQITFEKGYYIDNSNQKINCLIKNIDWKNNPTEFEYKVNENSEVKIATIKSIKEFSIDAASKYIRATVNIDRSSENINNLSMDKNPIFQEEQLFLKVLVEGKSNLYGYVDDNLTRYFYSKENTTIEQLIFKSYKTPENNIAKNNRFRQQLWVDLKCPNFKNSKIENLKYKKNDLVAFFTEYSACYATELINFEPKQKRDLFNLTIRPRIKSSSLDIKSDDGVYHANFGNKTGFGLGVETEFVLPFNKNKWAIAVEAAYQSFKSEKSININRFFGGVLMANVDYSSIEFSLGLRHYFFLNDHSKIFLNAAYVVDFNSKSLVKFDRNDGSSLFALDANTSDNIALGVGFKQNDRYGLELRYQTTKDILANYSYWNSEYKTVSIIVGYSFL